MADPTIKRYTHPFHVQLDHSEKGMLDQLASSLNLSRGALIRQLIFQRFRMQYAAEPQCATGVRCLCPQLQIQPGANPKSSTEILDELRI